MYTPNLQGKGSEKTRMEANPNLVFQSLLKDYANHPDNGMIPIKLDRPWKDCGQSLFVVEHCLVFDVERWRFVGWFPVHSVSTVLYPMDQLTNTTLKSMICARGWNDLVSSSPPSPKIVSSPLLFPICGEDRAIAHTCQEWVYLTGRQCWINRDVQRCSCAVCYPAYNGLREDGDYSIVQMTLQHCVYCQCEYCTCPLTGRPLIHNLSIRPAPQLRCTCVVCRLVSQKE
jgi:hypothetical protein